jgi:coenzyme F420-reducing hydrogenase beta subunit
MACPAQIIDIRLNNVGFYMPVLLNEDACVSCGICRSVCSFIDNQVAVKESTPKCCYASWNNDPDVREMCSSGGVGYEIARVLICDGYQFVGVKYDVQKNRTVHYVTEKEEELKPSMGSKYIQSYTVDAFKKINREDKYLITGTPCQIDSIRRYIRKYNCEDNFILLDFFCHGIPSMNLWEKYLKMVKHKTGVISTVSWRNKKFGWHDSWNMVVSGDKSEYANRWKTGDLFYKMFLSNCCLGKSCYCHCKYKGCSSSADIRIGDLWGKTYETTDKGVSGILVFSKKGEDVIKRLNCTLIDHPSEIICEGQMHHRIKKPMTHGLICWLLKSKLPLKFIYIIVQLSRLPYILKCKLKK